MVELRGLIPARFAPPSFPTKFEQQVLVNWLDTELPRKTEMAVLDQIAGWRNREVYYYIKSSDWTARMYEQPPGWWP